MAWIESHQSLARHRKTLHVVAALGLSRIMVIGHLHELWWWGLDNADINGHLGVVSPEILAESAGFPVKKAKVFVKSLLEAGGPGRAGFLEFDETTGEYTLHHWYQYAGRYNDQRERNRVRMQGARASSVQRTTSTNGDAHPAHVQDTFVAHAPHRAGLFGATNRTGPTGPDQPETPPSPPRLNPGEIVAENGDIYGPPNQDGDRWPTGRKAPKP